MLTGEFNATTADGYSIAGRVTGISNTFAISDALPWYRRQKFSWLFGVICTTEIILFVVGLTLHLVSSERELDDMNIAVDLGDLIVPPKKAAQTVVEIDEVFGNEFVKDKKPPTDNNLEDPRAATASNPYLGGATMPLDLTPDILPEYSAAARAAGVQGTVTLELVVSDEGTVLRAKPVGKPLGHGLDEAASFAFRRKRFKPSIKDGQPITVKFYQPVRFILN